jgi:hypothetical protein
VTRSGGPNGEGSFNGQARRYGFYHTSDQGERGLSQFYKVAKKHLAACGVPMHAEGTFPYARFVVDNRDPGTQQRNALASFQEEDVNTILWFGGVEGKFTPLASAAGYYPEIIVAGDLNSDNAANGQHQDQAVWRNARAVSYDLRSDRQNATQGYKAAVEGDRNLDSTALGFANEFYRDFFMLFTGIQIAGPKLSPERVTQGFHAIPERSSNNPFIAACFFDPNDYTCVKDSMEMWWDPTGKYPGATNPGCWRMAEEGRRYLAYKWSSYQSRFDVDEDSCNGYGGTYQLRPSPL